jgi:hypothetical protein
LGAGNGGGGGGGGSARRGKVSSSHGGRYARLAFGTFLWHSPFLDGEGEQAGEYMGSEEYGFGWDMHGLGMGFRGSAEVRSPTSFSAAAKLWLAQSRWHLTAAGHRAVECGRHGGENGRVQRGKEEDSLARRCVTPSS